MNLSELLPPPPEHPPPHHEMMMVGQRDGGGGGVPSDLGSCSLNRHNPHAYLYGNDAAPGPNMAETRFIENRCSPGSAYSCPPPAPHDRMMLPGMRNGNMNSNPAGNPYSDIEYPVHSRDHGNHGNHSLHNAPHHAYPRYQDGGGGGAGNGYGGERPYSPKLLNTGGGGGGGSSGSGSNRCQSPLSCHNCGSSYTSPPHLHQQQAPPPPAPPSSSSSSSNNSQHHHHQQQQQQQPQGYNPNNPHYHYHNNHPDPRLIQGPGGGVYPSVGGAYNHQPVALHGYRIPPMEAEYKSPEEDEGGVSMDRACQSSLPSLANDCLQAGYGRR